MTISLRLTMLSAALALVAGCGDDTPPPLTCEPVCSPGWHCTESGCVRDDGNLSDLAVPAMDGGGGTCSPACGAGTPHCNPRGLCVPCLEDAHCPTGQVCKVLMQTSICVPGCADDTRCTPGSRCCGGTCVDVSKDGQNCGSCGNACMGNNARASCEAGQCVIGSCLAGWGDCNMNPADGCETNLRSDPVNCTACGMTCNLANAVQGCSDGCYLRACKFGFDDCDADTKNGCEMNVLADVRNCGGCGLPCGASPNGRNGCVNGSCQLTSCNNGFADCDGMYANGCEVSTNTDINNCGMCGMKCGQGLVCSAGMCTCPNCNLPNAKSTCVNLKCVVAQCNVNWGDCDGLPQNGCERNVTSDASNCGQCGLVCAQGLVCVNGSCTCPNCQRANARTSCVNNMCQLDSCFPGFGNCDGNDVNGCEADLNNDVNNCGACANKCPQNNSCVAGKCEAYNCGGWTPLMVGGVVFCYSNTPGTCQQAHTLCEGLGNGYRLLCGDHWNFGRDGGSCGGGTAYTAYDMVNAFFKGSEGMGSWNKQAFDCVSGGLNNQCNGDVGNGANTNMNGKYAFCAPKNYYTANDGPAFANVCGQ